MFIHHPVRSAGTCPKGYAWAATPQANDDHKQMVECSAKGLCNRKTGECECFDGFAGEGCRRSACPNDCSGHGTCSKQGVCYCDYLWTGEGCAERQCPNNCSGRGACVNNVCQCDEGWESIDCHIRSCPLGCSGREYGLVHGKPQWAAYPEVRKILATLPAARNLPVAGVRFIIDEVERYVGTAMRAPTFRTPSACFADVRPAPLSARAPSAGPRDPTTTRRYRRWL